jgi:1,4-alpha-glucan branching enzyme
METWMTLNAFFPTEYQIHLFHEGTLYESYRLFGAHLVKVNEKIWTRFCVWAPNAKVIRLVGEFNNWNGEGYTFHRVNNEGIWILLVEENLEGCLYKYEVFTEKVERLLKSDPYGFYSEIRPNTASIVYSLDGFTWNDHEWKLRKTKKPVYSEPVMIYEVHAGSWKKKQDGRFYTYREMAEELIPYVREHGFTHIELLPLVEHPLDDSWGYQGTGYFSVTSRYGTPHDFMYFVDQCHRHGIGVILDWVPGHFCKDSHGLYQFDGSHLYEYQNSHDRENPVWGTANFDLGKTEVQSFLISNALFWIDYFHIDGFRIDAVANIIYWPNSDGNHPNPYGISFLKKLNRAVFQYDPTILMIAEDSTDWPHVTAPVHYGGLGFNYKWNMGWMNDILEYMETPSHLRSSKHNHVSFSLLYAFTENFILPFSHDEVVHGKKSLLDKMPGDYWQKFAQLRLLFGYMVCHPGKKLLFMGSELGQFSEWKEKEQLDWNLLDYDMHRKMNAYVKELIRLYKCTKPLYELDHMSEGFEWIDVNNYQQSIFSFIRRGKDSEDLLVIVCNFTHQPYHNYKVGVPMKGIYKEILNSDMDVFGGSGCVNKNALKAVEEVFHGKPYTVEMTVPPFGISILRPIKQKQRKERNRDGKEEMRSHAVGGRERE